MKHGFLILALVICFKPAFPFLEYVANYDYISKVLCINKDTPKMQCHGKCYLMKAVKAETENDQKDKPAEKFEYQLLYFHDMEETPRMDLALAHDLNSFYPPANYTSLFSKNLFKPPISLL